MYKRIYLLGDSYCQKDIIIQGRELKIPFWVHHDDVVVHNALKSEKSHTYSVLTTKTVVF